MRDLAVFDLDGTLLPMDSYRQLLMQHVWRDFPLLSASVKRALRLLTREKFAEETHRRLLTVLHHEERRQAWVSDLLTKIDTEVLRKSAELRQAGVTIVLLSASPGEYVKPLGSALGFDHSFGSHWSHGSYCHLYGPKKTEFVEKIYPKQEWRWSYAIADSDSDDHLLSRFATSERVQRA